MFSTPGLWTWVMMILDSEAVLAKYCRAHVKMLLPCLIPCGTATKILSSTVTGGLTAASLVMLVSLLAAVRKLCCPLSGVFPVTTPSISDVVLLRARKVA